MKWKRKLTLWVAVLCVITVITGMVACAPKANDPKAEQAAHNAEKFTGEQPDPDEFGVVTADQWKDIYPYEYASYQENLENSPDSDKHNYLELYPALNTLYAGYGFSKGYDEPASHLYSLESVTSTPRVNETTKAGCITCKTPQFTATVNSQGTDVYNQNFFETVSQYSESISCYNCHANDPSGFAIGNKFFIDSLGNDVGKVPVEAQTCGQCHNEYYFPGGVTTNPYTGLDQMTAEAMLAYYDEAGYSDWTYPDTGTPMVKVQHPEFETIYGGEQNYMAKLGYSCADCHMGTEYAEDGSKFVSHNWVSPLENQELLENDCMDCHKDLPGQVAEWQKQSETRVQSISLKIEELVKVMKEQIASGELTGDKLTQVQKLHRTSQWYWDYVMVENSEGAHNPTLSTTNLDKAEAAVDEALAML
ncbi:MAG: ammonia-forming cytochrome c nitrite reductase subunit c552 [Raoultibacter sp.]|jgi:nitrite reductase (cytochrome c-552)